MNEPALLPVSWAAADRHPELPGKTLPTVTCDNGELLMYDRETSGAWIQGDAVEIGEQGDVDGP